MPSPILLTPRLIALTTVVVLSLQPSLTRAEQAEAQQQPQEEERITLVQTVRRLLGLSRRVAVGGSRSGGAGSICLITPELTQVDGQVQARVTVPSPVIVTAGPLNELSVLRDGRVIYRKLASSSKAIVTPFSWPLPPLQGGEQLTLKLRPRGAAGGSAARIPLMVASADVLRRNEALLRREQASEGQGTDAGVLAAGMSPALQAQLVFAAAIGAGPGESQADNTEIARMIREQACNE